MKPAIDKSADPAAAVIATIVAVAGSMGWIGDMLTADQLAELLGALLAVAAVVRAILVRKPPSDGEGDAS